MSNRSLGGKTLGTASGISRRAKPVGLYNIGLLVESWGRITDIGPDYFLISDGSDGDVKVRCCGFDLPFYWPDDYIKVIGISSMEDGNRTLLISKPNDIRLM